MAANAVQRAVYTKLNVAQYPPPHLIHSCLDQGIYTSSVSPHRCLATRAAAREVAAPLEDDGDDMDDEQEDFDEEFVAEESVGRQIIVGNADWCSVATFLVLHAALPAALLSRPTAAVADNEIPCRSKAVYSSVLECLQEPGSEDLELYMFRATPDKFVEVRLDKVCILALTRTPQFSATLFPSIHCYI
jgi:hypothetical protein